MDTMDAEFNPYKALPARHFWKNAVRDAPSHSVKDLWVSKFPLGREDGIITVGSCFAQHISDHLRLNGFNWIDSEPAPGSLPPEKHRENGYGIFSFRTGNIYTPALLEQWIDMALGKKEIIPEAFIENGRYHDPLRPALNAQGFDSLQDMLDARTITLEAIRISLQQANTFIFTLGLTEAWRHIDKHIYPVCPGTVKGRFIAGTHLFHNFDYDEIVQSMENVFAAIREINPSMRFLLTVSPVPLTATFSSSHVVTASTYSKSVLRAAAGFLASRDSHVDYFPSYELVSSPLFNGRAFAANKRTVTKEGVSGVMRHFLSSIGEKPGMSVAPAIDEASGPVVLPQATGDDLICEDIILEQWSKKDKAKEATIPDILLVGDSHMGMIGDRLKAVDIAYMGGGIMWGSQWHMLQFVPDPTTIFIPINEPGKALWQRTLSELGGGLSVAQDTRLTIITNIGCHSHTLQGGFVAYLNNKYERIPPNIETHDIRNYLLSERSVHLGIVKQLVASGHDVIWVSDPPAQDVYTQLYAAFDTVLCEYFAAVGARALNARKWIAAKGGWSEKHCSPNIDAATGKPDRIHGSDHYYQILAHEITRDPRLIPESLAI